MTAIIYPDLRACSFDGSFTLEARSPHNGSIPHRDGRLPSDDEFPFKYRQHQREFRYQLLDHRNEGPPLLVWERWQDSSAEDSPHELVVSDEGWSIIRTHGFRPEVIAVSPSGAGVLRVRITSRSPIEREVEGASCTWSTAGLALSTAGSFWTDHSWRYFVEYDERPHF